MRQREQKTRFGSTCEIRGSARRAAARCSAFRRRDSCVGGKFVGFKSLNGADEIFGAPAEFEFVVFSFGERVGNGGDRMADDETRANKCFDGGGTLSIVGITAL